MSKLSLMLATFLSTTLVNGGAVRADAPATPIEPTSPYVVRQFGAVGDGKTKDTAAIQKAIDVAAEHGGGTVAFPPGTYLSGTLRLASHVTLYLDAGATLLGSTDLADFPEIVPAMRSFTDNYTCRSLIYAEKAADIALLGRGTIDGQGADRAFRGKPYKLRPYGLRFIECTGVRVEGLYLRSSPMWMQHYLGCEDVTIRGLNVFNQSNRNNDMMDIDGCRNVVIADCMGDSEDDAITLKATNDRPTENVTITNCVLSSRCNAIKCGTESNGGFRNIAISNITVRPTTTSDPQWLHHEGLAAVALQLVDGGTMDGVTVTNLSARGTTAPIFIRLGNRARPFREGDPKPPMGTLRNVTISNVEATGVTAMPCSITGLPGYPVQNVTLSNIRITYLGGGKNTRPASEVPEVPGKYPDGSMFGDLPAYGLYCRHVEGLTLRNIQVGWAKADQRPALLFDDVRDLSLDTFRAQLAPEAPAAIVFRDVRAAMLRGCRAPADAAAFLQVEGASADILLFSNQLRGAKTPVLLGAGVPESAVQQVGNRTTAP